MFRQVRDRIANAAGCHTIAGEVRLRKTNSSEAITLIPAEIPVKPGTVHCWILDRGRKLPLKIGMNSVGRLPDNDVVIDDATVSRRHCAIVIHSDLSFELHDVASKNGTLLNGRKIAGATQLNDGDEITLCERRLTFLSVPGQKPASVHLPAASQSWSGEHTQIG
ncbi:FHA domain-containing protein [Zavarzinella formosa]|uniref:FHA domain-containing protein n=1 Tax=Zavarzinella formosa TaxID=360055 RepID=UPI000313D8EA|nr:FHA domain-containing protein [Zavarzinella formosa]